MTDHAPLTAEIALIRQCHGALIRIDGELTGLQQRLERRVEGGVKGVFNDPSTPVDARAKHRRAHRAGVPAKLDADPELRGFVQARLATMTFDDIVRAVADAFPPPRRISRSSLHRWWHRCGKHDTTA